MSAHDTFMHDALPTEVHAGPYGDNPIEDRLVSLDLPIDGNAGTIRHTGDVSILTRHHAGIAREIEYGIVDFAGDARDPESVRADTSAWINSREMTELLCVFGYQLKAVGLQDRLHEAEQISRDIFDFRGGGERWEARKVEFSDATIELLDALVERIYREPTTTSVLDLPRFDHALVLGGRLNSCMFRAELLASLLRGGLQVDHIWGLGSRRTVTDDERRSAAEITAAPVEDELDVMSVALVENLDLDAAGVAVKSPGTSEVRTLATTPIPVIGLAAAPGQGKVRATTSDTYRFFVDTADHCRDNDSVLVVTSAIHGPFQHAQALSELALQTGAIITTVGAHIGTTRHDMVRAQWTTAEWLQEIRSAIWSMRLMWDAFVNHYPKITP